MFDAIYVINLDRGPERWQWMQTAILPAFAAAENGESTDQAGLSPALPPLPPWVRWPPRAGSPASESLAVNLPIDSHYGCRRILLDR